MKTQGRDKKGQVAESRALEFLAAQGLSCLQRNYRCSAGEIDLIMSDRDTTVFVEVRFRQDPGFMHPLETITPAKQRRIINTSRHYLQRFGMGNSRYYRFDVMALCGTRIEWIKDAFSA